MTYSDLLKDPKWQKMRLKILERDLFTCTYCGEDQETLHVHHKIYLPNRKPWEYSEDCLTTLCHVCHNDASKGMKESIQRLGEAIKKFGLFPKDIDQISEAFEKSKPQHIYEVTASAIAHGISNMQTDLIKSMLKHFRSKGKQNGKGTSIF
jgi:hypothetical protein